jgi:hypothetical protein
MDPSEYIRCSLRQIWRSLVQSQSQSQSQSPNYVRLCQLLELAVTGLSDETFNRMTVSAEVNTIAAEIISALDALHMAEHLNQGHLERFRLLNGCRQMCEI